MRLRIIFLSIFLFAILLSGCNNRVGPSLIVAGGLVGVWQTEDFNDNPLDFAVEMYITNDNNLHIVILFGSEEWIFHYQYKIEDDVLTLTSVLNPSNYEYEEQLYPKLL